MPMNEVTDLILPYKDKLYRVALRIVGDALEAEDVVQEVFIKIWKKKEYFLKIENKEAWCLTTTRNLAIDKLRARKAPTSSIDNYYHLKDHGMNPHQQAQSNDTMGKIRLIIETLPQKQKLVLHLRDVEGYSYKEISTITNLSLDQVKINLYRARQILKDKLIEFI
jgi:RNA polymerase sigma-70 factor (ECF subfamily)